MDDEIKLLLREIRDIALQYLRQGEEAAQRYDKWKETHDSRDAIDKAQQRESRRRGQITATVIAAMLTLAAILCCEIIQVVR